MTLFQAIIYGLVQGLTEFLPVSSSAHLILLPYFTGWKDPGLAFDVALHWGTLAAVFIYFRSDVAVLLKNGIASLRGERSSDRMLPWKIVVATVPGVIMGFLCEKQAETIFRSPYLLATTLSVIGLALWGADRRGSKTISLDRLSWSQAIVIGLGQGLAIVPGVSRSGITMTTALLLGLDRPSAVRFSFYLAMPITLGAGVLKIKYLVQNLGDPSIMAGIAASALFGLLAIHVLLTYVRTRSFTPFVIYRLILAAAVVIFTL